MIADKYITLLQQLISSPSYSGKEQDTASIIESFLTSEGIEAKRIGNNVFAHKSLDSSKPIVLLNSHHDTVKPASGYTRDPFQPTIEDGKLYGLGSNDAGGALVSLLASFLSLYDKELPFNLVFAASAEEENSGPKGMELLLTELPTIDLAIVGEPTLMKVAVAEKGLVVLDCESKGQSGHAAREEGTNAIYTAMQDIEWFRSFKFPRASEHLGEVKMTVTQIKAGTQHNVVPDKCHFVVDVRVTDAYTLEEVVSEIRQHVKSEITPRSLRLNSSGIAPNNPILETAKKLEIETYGSPTMSDQALMSFDSVKIGPGDSARSHMADEFIYITEIEQGINLYTQLIRNLHV